jgi:hypothetical protein
MRWWLADLWLGLRIGAVPLGIAFGTLILVWLVVWL